MLPKEAAAVAAARDRSAGALPVLLADRQGVAFVATARGVESLRVPRRYWGMQVGVVPVPASDEEIRAADLETSDDAGTWPRVIPRTDLLAPALSRLLARDHVELSLQPSRDGLKAGLLTAQGEEQPFPTAPKDALGFLAAVFHHAPRGVVRTGSGKPGRVVLSVRPSARRHEYRVRLVGAVGPETTATLTDLGLSPAVLELLLESLERPAGMILVSGGPGAGRSTTLEALAATLLARGLRGGRVGPRGASPKTHLAWLAEGLSDWPFPESLHAAAPDFALVERLQGAGDLVLAARLAASGTLVLAGAPAAEPGALARTVGRDLETGSAPAVPLVVLGQSLVRTVCRSCLTWRTLDAPQARRQGFHRRDVEEMARRGGLAIPAGGGCHDCAGTGAYGLTGVFEYVGPEGPGGTLPLMREEGWRKVVQGTASLEDVDALPGAHCAMRTLREIMVHAGAAQGMAEPLGPPVARPGTPAEATAGVAALPSGDASLRSAPATDEARLLSRLLKESLTKRPPDPEALTGLCRTLVARASRSGPLEEMLAPQRGFQLAAHCVNSALIAVRIAAHLGPEADLEGVARLGLLHDAGLAAAGVEPDADLPGILSEESLFTPGLNRDPSIVLAALDAVGAAAPLVEQVHALLRFEAPAASERLSSDLRAQVVALASLIDMHFHGPADKPPADLNEVTSLVMDQHGRRFSPVLFRALLRAIPVFPIGALVELSSGDLARIVSLNEDNHFRPRVEIAASGGETFSEPRLVDLARAPFLHIRQRVAGAAVGAGRGVR
jgi:hypothetical protein